ncbi:T9SS type A sorting domain-containing protein [Aequorivita capsosiphonis]|uniref:T9SS type A sorting domain-containing protein n=1 Tax=Aequorivita capsosiphonis TaxID=487317 RepID=UPI00040149C1|nr:T9SS type A sorting domain-containing protein [Aequorivita capsosiphonis]
MKTITTLLALLLSVITLQAQNSGILWQKTIGGTNSDMLSSIIETSDGGYLVGGTSESDISGEKSENSKGGKDYWILKLDTTGNIVWQKTYGGDADDGLGTFKQTSDGGYIMGGTSKSGISGDKTEDSRGKADYWMLKLDSNGNIEWQKTYGGNEYDKLVAIVETNDGGYLVAGQSSSAVSGDRTVSRNGLPDAWVLKLDSSGAIVWQKSYGSTDYNFACNLSGLAKTNDGGFILSSDLIIFQSQNFPFWVLKIDASGNEIWDRTIKGDKIDWFPKINSNPDGSYIIAGISNSDAYEDKTENAIDESFDYWVLKLDETGTIVWQNTIGGAGQEGGVGAMSQTTDGGYLICGYSDSNISGDKTENSKGSSDFWFLKLNKVGIIEWQKTIGGSLGEIGGRSIQTGDGNFLTAGSSESNISGDKTENSRGGYDYWIVKHAATLGIEENTFFGTISIYPNPVNSTLQINTQGISIDQINIYTILGSRVRQMNVDTVSPSVDVSSLASGVYYIQFYSGKNVALKKFIKE